MDTPRESTVTMGGLLGSSGSSGLSGGFEVLQLAKIKINPQKEVVFHTVIYKLLNLF